MRRDAPTQPCVGRMLLMCALPRKRERGAFRRRRVPHREGLRALPESTAAGQRRIRGYRMARRRRDSLSRVRGRGGMGLRRLTESRDGAERLSLNAMKGIGACLIYKPRTASLDVTVSVLPL